MSYYFINKDTLSNIADSIRIKTNTNNNYTASNMASAIMNISGGGVDGSPLYYKDSTIYINCPSIDNNIGNFLMYQSNDNNIKNLLGKSVTEINIMGGVTNMFRAFNCYMSSPVNMVNCGNNVINYSYAFASARFSNLTASCGEKVINMNGTYYSCQSLIGSPVCGNNVVDMGNAYAQCWNLTGSPVCGDNVKSMQNAYFFCNNLTGKPACGNNVVNMKNAYFQCSKLTGSPVCGDNVVDMGGAYFQCYNLTGNAVCGDNVINMYQSYSYCNNLTNAVCGNNVIDASYAYQSISLIKEPKIGNNVVFADYMYSNDINLQNFAICNSIEYAINMYSVANNTDLYQIEPISSNSIINAANMYAGRLNLIGTPSFGRAMENMTNMFSRAFNMGGTCIIQHPNPNMKMCFFRTENSPMLNVIIRKNSPIDINIYNNGIWGYIGSYSGSSENINWITIENGYYSEGANLYIYNNYNYLNYYNTDASYEYYDYNGEQVNLIDIYDNNAEVLYQTFYNLNNTIITGDSYMCSDNVINFRATYKNSKLVYPPVCGSNVIDMRETYKDSLVIGAPICGDNVVNMFGTYSGCYNLTGSPVCGPNVTNMSYTYYRCNNLTGSPICGENVTDMAFAYFNCSNLTGNIYIGNNVKNIMFAFNNCTNLSGTVYIPNTVLNTQEAFAGCSNLQRIIFNDGLLDIGYNCCGGCVNANIYLPESILSMSGNFSGVKHICYYGDKNNYELGVPASKISHHQYDINILPNKIEPTCTEYGSTGIFTCKHCGLTSREEDIEVIPPLGHEPENPELEFTICTRCEKEIAKSSNPIELKWELNNTTDSYPWTLIDENILQWKSGNNGYYDYSSSGLSSSATFKLNTNNISESIIYEFSIFVNGYNNDSCTITLNDETIFSTKGSQNQNLQIELNPGIEYLLTINFTRKRSGSSYYATATLPKINTTGVTWIEI